MESVGSWGNYPRVQQKVVRYQDSPAGLPLNCQPILPYGMGRSYGDCCLNAGGTVLVTTGMNRILFLDTEQGVVRCEAGATLGEIAQAVLPNGYFLPVTPGTQFVTVGGAIANDVHGKNHHRRGTFGSHVRRFCLLRSDGERLECSLGEHSKLFSATIGGLGLTGLILWAEFALVPVETPLIDSESVKFRNLEEFFEICNSSDKSYEHTVAWLDCLSAGTSFGRGLFMRGNFASADRLSGSGWSAQEIQAATRFRPRASVPFNFPPWALNHWSMRLFNELYYHKQFKRQSRGLSPVWSFFYPLDAVSRWNRIYGQRGFFQFQFVVPERTQLESLLRVVVSSGQGSFLAVVKAFGESESPAMMSFPRPGWTLALDFPNRGNSTIELFRRLESMVMEAGGALYPAKDATMLATSFERCYPRCQDFAAYIDPAFSSSFWRRVSL